MKNCKDCEGRGVVYIVDLTCQPGPLGQGVPKLCPCVTERMTRLERVAGAARNLLEMYEEVHWRDPERDIEAALKALEET